MGKVVQLDTYRATEHADTPKPEDQSHLLAECENLNSDLSRILEGFRDIREIIIEYNKTGVWHLKG